MLPSALIKAKRRGGFAGRLGDRLGIYPEFIKKELSGLQTPLWVHAVSVGETNVALKLIAELKRQAPDQDIVLSSTTPTGFILAEAKAPQEVVCIYAPLDFPSVVRKAFQQIQPRQVVLMESELWYNFLRCAQKNEVPVSLANARISERSARRYQRLRMITSPMLDCIDFVYIQDESERGIWEKVGIDSGRIIVTGSIKYDPQNLADTSIEEKQRSEYQRYLREMWGGEAIVMLAASTHAGEETCIVEAYKNLREEFPKLRLVLVPRHIERSDEIVAELSRANIEVIRRSSLSPDSFAPPAPDSVLLVDTTGELAQWQRIVGLVVIGKSLLEEGATGGQNPAEAACAGVPVICGPHMENFAVAMNLLKKADGIVQLEAAEQLEKALALLLADEDRRGELSKNGKEALENHRHATRYTAEMILEQEEMAEKLGLLR